MRGGKKKTKGQIHYLQTLIRIIMKKAKDWTKKNGFVLVYTNSYKVASHMKTIDLDLHRKKKCSIAAGLVWSPSTFHFF